MLVLTYLDDVFTLGLQGDALRLVYDLWSSSVTVGLQVAEAKCQVFLPPSESLSLPNSDLGTVILGTPIGIPAFVTSHCELIVCGVWSTIL